MEGVTLTIAYRDGEQVRGEFSQHSASALSPAGQQQVAAMNARTYAMSPEDREHWYAEHPVSDFGRF